MPREYRVVRRADEWRIQWRGWWWHWAKGSIPHYDGNSWYIYKYKNKETACQMMKRMIEDNKANEEYERRWALGWREDPCDCT